MLPTDFWNPPPTFLTRFSLTELLQLAKPTQCNVAATRAPSDGVVTIRISRMWVFLTRHSFTRIRSLILAFAILVSPALINFFWNIPNSPQFFTWLHYIARVCEILAFSTNELSPVKSRPPSTNRGRFLTFASQWNFARQIHTLVASPSDFYNSPSPTRR